MVVPNNGDMAQAFNRWRITGILLSLGVAAGVLAVVMWAPWQEPGADRSYDTRIAEPALQARGPSVLFDEGHRNTHSISGRFAAFANLLRADGATVRSTSIINQDALKGHQLLVIVNASGPEPNRHDSAFSSQEVEAIHEWVLRGGSLLLVADHHPYGPAASTLAEAFAVQMTGGWCEDEANFLKGTADSGAILFKAADGQLGDHPIIAGRNQSEAVRAVATFTGQSLIAPTGATPLVIFAATAIDRVPISSVTHTQGGTTTTTFETRDDSAAGHCQGLAMTVGKGRVVVLGEAAMLSAQIDAISGLKFGMNVPGLDNRQFVLNTLRWLVGELD